MGAGFVGFTPGGSDPSMESSNYKALRLVLIGSRTGAQGFEPPTLRSSSPMSSHCATWTNANIAQPPSTRGQNGLQGGLFGPIWVDLGRFRLMGGVWIGFVGQDL